MEQRTLLATLSVTNTDDSGAGSFRQAILDASAHANDGSGPDVVVFNIPGPGVHTIAPTASLPVINDPVVIDGYTQPGTSPNTLEQGDNAVLSIELDGTVTPLFGGLVLSSDGSTVRGLMMNRFGFAGIFVGANNTLIEGSLIGTDSTGTQALPNEHGILVRGHADVIGGVTPAARNLVSGNLGTGVQLANRTSGSVVEGNFIGTDMTGTAAIGNRSTGITLVEGASDNTIGGTAAAARNIISGNDISSGDGASVFTSNSASRNVLEGNFIGSDVTGMQPLPNITGIALGVGTGSSFNTTIGGTAAGAGNVISGNLAAGLALAAGPGTVAQGNFIGTAADGTSPLANGSDGVVIGFATGGSSGGSGITIGGTAAGAGNVIAFNAGRGVMIGGVALGDSILSNSIYSNAGIGIDLNGDGASHNDPHDSDGGENNTQNFPVITSVTTAGGATTIQGTLDSTPSTDFLVQFFNNDGADPSSFGEGQRLIGQTTVTTDAGGQGSFAVILRLAVSPTQFVTTTATDTSEFSQLVADLAVMQRADVATAAVDQDLVFTTTVTNAGPFPASGATLTDALPSNTTFVSATGVASPSAQPRGFPAIRRRMTGRDPWVISAPARPPSAAPGLVWRGMRRGRGPPRAKGARGDPRASSTRSRS
jgi:uncharacterized repeat protein (TIGR01451 family)